MYWRLAGLSDVGKAQTLVEEAAVTGNSGAKEGVDVSRIRRDVSALRRDVSALRRDVDDLRAGGGLHRVGMQVTQPRAPKMECVWWAVTKDQNSAVFATSGANRACSMGPVDNSVGTASFAMDV